MSPLRLRGAFDSATSFAAWLTQALPRYQSEATAHGVLVREGPVTGILLQSAPGGLVKLEPTLPSLGANALIRPSQVLALFAAIAFFYEEVKVVAASPDADALSWWAGVSVAVACASLFPLWLVRAARSTALDRMSRELAVVLEGGAVADVHRLAFDRPRVWRNAATMCIGVVGLLIAFNNEVALAEAGHTLYDTVETRIRRQDAQLLAQLRYGEGPCGSRRDAMRGRADSYERCMAQQEELDQRERVTIISARKDVARYKILAIILLPVSLVIIAWGAGSTLVGVALALALAFLAALARSGLLFA